MSTNELTFDDLKVLIPPRPFASVQLPSLGLYYDQEVVKDGCIELCPLSGRDLKLISGIRGHNVDDIIDTILGRCMKTEIDPDDLLVTDRFYLLLMLRANSFGADYGFELTCDKCQSVSRHSVKIPEDFEIIYSNPDEDYPFTLTLPDSGIQITYRLLTARDHKEIKNAVEKDDKKGLSGQGDSAYLYSMAKSLLTINGKSLNLLVALQFVERLSAKDANYLQMELDSKNPGLVPAVTKKCTKCGTEMTVGLPITAEFFRPKS